MRFLLLAITYDYDTLLAVRLQQFLTAPKVSLSIRKGGDGACLKKARPHLAGWSGNDTIFQTQVGLKTGDTEELPAAGDPTEHDRRTRKKRGWLV